MTGATANGMTRRRVAVGITTALFAGAALILFPLLLVVLAVHLPFVLCAALAGLAIGWTLDIATGRYWLGPMCTGATLGLLGVLVILLSKSGV
ncbi:hypothetical protein MWU52_15350 [Jannaschia sp. S6380]|uniref:hypothetical protein n=1 Tax=Jannaschia sp. S6380 TaxID=2926408 RepID=UPI001FF1312B|nr:hypothetical protein [Jannaschia sp. S6380]MCK0168930.1 hypothetical protein [Jannaschia sp. S6380]